jgi:hypothetical protein
LKRLFLMARWHKHQLSLNAGLSSFLPGEKYGIVVIGGRYFLKY